MKTAPSTLSLSLLLDYIYCYARWMHAVHWEHRTRNMKINPRKSRWRSDRDASTLLRVHTYSHAISGVTLTRYVQLHGATCYGTNLPARSVRRSLTPAPIDRFITRPAHASPHAEKTGCFCVLSSFKQDGSDKAAKRNRKQLNWLSVELQV